MEVTTDRLDGIVMRFKELGYRITPQRMAIVQVLLNDMSHPTVEQVYEKVKRDFPMTSRATVYKTIGLLKDLGEISELNFSNGGSHFDGFKADMHPHLDGRGVSAQKHVAADEERGVQAVLLQDGQSVGDIVGIAVVEGDAGRAGR